MSSRPIVSAARRISVLALALMAASASAQRSSAVPIEEPAAAPAASPASPGPAALLLIDVLDETGAPLLAGPPFVDVPPPGPRRSFETLSLHPPWAFRVEADRSYVVSWFHREHGLVEREVWAGCAGSAARTTLVAGPRYAPSRLTIGLQDAGGEPLMERLVTSVCSPWTGRALVEHPPAGKTDTRLRDLHHHSDERRAEPAAKDEPVAAEPATFVLPPGRYVVRAGPRGTSSRDPLAWHLPVETMIDLGEGEERALALAPRLGGHVRLVLAAPAGKRMHATAIDAAGGEAVPLRFCSASGCAGFLTTRRPLAPGRYTLAVDVPGFAPETVAVEIVAGRMVDAPLRLFRASGR